MKKIYISLFFICTVFLVACNNKTEFELRAEKSRDSELQIVSEEELDNTMDEQRDSVEISVKKNIACSEIYVDNSKICGLISVGEYIYSVDYKNGCIKIIDEAGEVVKTVGKLGSAYGEFQNPTGITKDEKYIYVLDDGNSRIQVFDYDLEYVKEFVIDKSELDPEIVFEDMEIDENGIIYLSGCFLINPGVYVINTKTEEQFLKEINFSGFLSKENGKVKGLSSGQLYLPDEEPISFGIGTGKCAFIECSLVDSRKKFDLEGIHMCSDFIIKESKIYCVSQYYNELQVFDNNGSYIESLGKLDPNAIIQYICATSDGKIYVSDNSSRLFVFQEK